MKDFTARETRKGNRDVLVKSNHLFVLDIFPSKEHAQVQIQRYGP